MTVPSQRRRDPQPIGRGWDAAAAGAGGVLIFVALAALTGLGIASALFGGGWVWPHGTGTIAHVLGGLLHGHPGRGLPPNQEQRVPGPVAVYVCVAISELALLATAVLAGVLIARYRRPGDARGGMATRREAQQALGRGQLRAARVIIRPDRYGPGAENLPQAETTVSRSVHRLRIGLGTVHGFTKARPLGRLARHGEPIPPSDHPTTRKGNRPMTEADDLPSPDPATARAQAAALFSAAARSDAAGPGAVLHCLEAVRALQAPNGPVPATFDATDPDRLIERALHILGSLPPEDFAHPQVRTAARHGRRALTEPR